MGGILRWCAFSGGFQLTPFVWHSLMRKVRLYTVACSVSNNALSLSISHLIEALKRERERERERERVWDVFFSSSFYSQVFDHIVEVLLKIACNHAPVALIDVSTSTHDGHTWMVLS